MQRLTEDVFQLAPPGGLFDETVVMNLYANKTPGARKQLINRALKNNEIFRLKKGVYILASNWRRTDPHPFVVASRLYSPSHISLESALSFHGLIPEAVFQVASVTTRRRQVFDTPMGYFTFDTVPSSTPRAGVKAHRFDGDLWAFIAEPVRALADMIYLNKTVSWSADGLRWLVESLRIEESDLEDLSFGDLDEMTESFRNRRVVEFLEGLAREFAT